MESRMILLLCISFSACFLLASSQEQHILAEDFVVEFSDKKLQLSLKNKENGATLKGQIGFKLNEEESNPIKCTGQNNCLQFGSDLKLTVDKKDSCHFVLWSSTSKRTLEDCFFYEGPWYGGPESKQQLWPFNNMTYKKDSYITKEAASQAIAEPYFLSSRGFYIYVDKATPLFIDSNNHIDASLCFISEQESPYINRQSVLKYKICSYKNAKEAHMQAVQNELGKPTGIPDERMVQHPIWSTWVRFKADVNEEKVRTFAKQIVDNKFNNSQLELDDKWETCYGSGQFDKSRFPDMNKLSEDLHKMGFRVTLWSHPFVNILCQPFSELKDRGFLVQNHDGHHVTLWWNGVAGVVDFTNPEAADWFVTERKAMMTQNGIDSLKMDAGESSFIPQIPKLTGDVTDQPNVFTADYVTAVAKFGPLVEVRTGYRTQNLPVFVRMIDKDSKWTFDNGLPTLITTLLQMNLNGYPFVLPDMVGGNAYNGDTVSKELFIRWLQANVFMPSIQFSAAPWDYDDETVEICRKFTALHWQYSGLILERMKESVQSGVPVNLPIWWVSPDDPTAHTVWSEYMLGEDLLVAPVLEEGATTRDIYLPEGRWRDESNPEHPEVQGGAWIKNHPAPLNTLPYFTRIK